MQKKGVMCMNDTIRITVRDPLGMNTGVIVNIAKFNRD